MTLVKVNLHCHSNLSDGQLSPEALAAWLARGGVRYAALTDHDTVEGLARFRESLGRHGAGCVTGVELGVPFEGRDVHLLAYGFDPASPALSEALERARSAPAASDRPRNGKQAGETEVETAIRLLHQAGGRVFLAHPYEFERDDGKLRETLTDLKAIGLDGIEAVYGPYTPAEIQSLLDLARGLGLTVCGGSDFHGQDHPTLSGQYVNLPQETWRTFRDSLLVSPDVPPRRPAAPVPSRARKPVKLDWRRFLLRILLPTVLAIALFVIPFFAWVIPAFEEGLMARKREMIRELTHSACSILQEYHDDEAAGKLSREAAQAAAAGRIRFLRYGHEGKDYFWITDLHPRMVMHPYRADLEGQDLTGYQDPHGNRLFVEAVRLVKERREGVIQYWWQWKDDAGRLAPKQSYVQLFEPWGWIVGTGLYIEDVQVEMEALTGKVIRVSVVVAVVIALLLLFVAQQSFRSERRRLQAEDSLRESHEKYRALVHAAQEGTLLVLDGRCVFANPTFLDWMGYTEAQWALMELDEALVLDGDDPGTAADWVASFQAGAEALKAREARLIRKDGTAFDVLLTPEPIRVGEREGFIINIRDLSMHKEVQAALDDSRARFRAVAENLRVGIFRAAVDDRRFPVLEANAAATRMLGLSRDESGLHGNLSEALSPSEALEDFRRDLVENGEVKDRVLHLPLERGGAAVSISATLVRSESGDPKYCDAVAEDATARERETTEREALIADLQSPFQFLEEPVTQFMREPVSAGLQTTVAQAALLMTGHGLGAILVKGPGGEPIGIFTDQDLRERVVAQGISTDRPVFEVMTSPLLTVSAGARGFEAFTQMSERGVRYLAVLDDQGAVAGLLRRRDLLQLDRYPLLFLARSIREAGRVEQIARHRERLPATVKVMVDGGIRSRHISWAVTALNDAIADRLIQLAVRDLGEPPARFAFIVLGSGGREEQTLLSDQDNAIVYETPPEGKAAEVMTWFLELGARVCTGLELAGYPACPGDMMARNPRWCQSLDGWKRHFSRWISVGEPKNIVEFCTFVDFRCIHGDPALAETLRAHVATEIAENPSFLGHLARTALQQKPPLGFFGTILSGSGPHREKHFDLKEALGPIVHYARLYALRNGFPETATGARLRRLHEAGQLSRTGYEELAQAIELIMGLRLRVQAERLVSGLAAGNLVDLKTLSHGEITTLKQALTQMATLQKNLAFDYPVGG